MNDADASLLRTRASLLFRLQQSPQDQAAWDLFVTRYGPQVAAWCRRWGMQDADADDVTQTVLLQLTRKLPEFQYDPTKRFRSWIKTIAQHAWSDFHRGKQRKDVGSGDSAIFGMLDNLEARDDLVDRLQKTFDQELLERACDEVRGRVEERTWKAFELTAIHGMKGAEAAKQLGMQVATVYVAKSKVQAMLKDIVQELEDQA